MRLLLPLLLALGLAGLAQVPSDFVARYDGPALREVAFRQNGQLAAYAYLDAEDRVVEAQYFGSDGAIVRRVRRVYDGAGRLLREVETSFRGHEWDAIREYTYDGDVLVGKLFGNNHTGRWGSEGYVYNDRGDLATVEHYRKNGVLGYRTYHDLSYDDAGRVLRRVTTKEVVPVDSAHAAWENELAIGDAANPEARAAAEAKTTTVYAYDERGRRRSTTVRDHRDRVTVETAIAYDGARRTERSTYYDVETGAVDFREASVYDARDRLVDQRIGGDTTRYRYAGESDFVIGRD